MPFVFTTFGVLLIVAGVRGQTSTLFSLIKSDFSGQPNYFEWMVAIFVVGSFGYIKQLSTISRMFMFMVLAGLLYQNKAVFGDLTTQETAQPLPASGTTTSNTTQGVVNGLPTLPTLTSLQSAPISVSNSNLVSEGFNDLNTTSESSPTFDDSILGTSENLNFE